MRTQIKAGRRFLLTAVFFICLLISGKAQAADNGRLVDNNGVLNYLLNDVAQTDCYLSVQSVNGVNEIVKPLAKGSVIYYFDQTGAGSIYTGTHFIPIQYNGSSKIYYAQKGNLLKNQIAGNKAEGYYYVDTTGVRITDKTVKYAVQFVRKHTKTSDSNKTKLKKCYDYLWKHYKYSRIYASPSSRALNPKAADMSKIAKQMFKSKKGNCHRYAACFAYIARVLGYDSKVVVGTAPGSGGRTPHGWTKVSYNKTGNKYKWYLCDPDVELHRLHVYMVSHHPWGVREKWTCTLQIKDGKVKWK